MNDAIITELGKILAARRTADPADSYAASLYQAGREKILRKIGEEAIETVLAGQAGNDDAIVHEIADLWFHTLILLADAGMEPAAVLAELERRFDVSGHTEKARRANSHD